MKRPALLLPSALLVLGLALSACGGSDDSSSDAGDKPADAAISQADFVEQANAICSDAGDAFDAEAAKLDESSDIEAFVTDVAVPNFQAQHDDIAALGAPEGQEEDVQTLLDALQSGIDAMAADPAGATDEDSTSFDDANAAATELGLTDCAGD